ncbi:MAG TPA: hypothetical protein PKC69_00430 [Chitinophagaceae bacterium]|nr:hypothetical protein [Chitinophagaceae bacterium]
MAVFRLDKTKFKAQTAAEASDHRAYYQALTWRERLKIAAFLNSQAFNYPPDKPPKMDKTKFRARSRNK